MKGEFEQPTDTGEESLEPGLYFLVRGESVSSLIKLPTEGEHVIGRSPESSQIHIPERTVSRKHALLRTGGVFTLEDLGSANGSAINNKPLEPGRRSEIRAGDVVRFGDAMVLVHEQRKGRQARGRIPRLSVAEAALPVYVDAEPMRSVYKLVDQVARGNINVLITGETGTGKEVIARTLHTRSPRALKPFLGVNCGALTESLLQSELFGHEKGAFTGAVGAKEGLLEAANGGTVFLDEIGEMPLPLQANLLRVLEERAVVRVGATSPRPIDVRFVAATNRALESEIASGRFRKDLFFRLAGVTIEVPPLRKRPAELEPIARHYVQLFCEQLGRGDVPDLPRETLDALAMHDWPGNVRELRNVIERAVLICGEGPILAQHLPDSLDPRVRKAAPPSFDPSATHTDADVDNSDTGRVSLKDLKSDMKSAERDRIQAALDACAGNQTRAAEMLGISRRALTNKLNQYGFARPRKKSE